jgi:hypothetical protein
LTCSSGDRTLFGDLRTSSTCRLDVGKVLGRRDEVVEVVGVDHGGHAPAAMRQVHRVVPYAGLIDDVGRTRSSAGHGELSHAPSLRCNR